MVSGVSTAADTRPADPPPGLPDGRTSVRWDLALGAVAVLLVVVADVVPPLLSTDPRGNLTETVAPLLANWLPHVGRGTPFAVVIALATVVWGPAAARRLSWVRLLLATYVLTLGWSMSLALVDGWQRGFAGRLSSEDEYLAEVPRVSDVHHMLQTFTTHIIDYQPGRWTTHVAGHPPGAFLVYVGLDRVGLGGGTFASLLSWLVAGSVGVAVLVAVRALAGRSGSGPDGEQLARRAAPFLALAPAAVWFVVSADGMFAAVSAWGIALLALAATRSVRRPVVTAAAAGVVLGFGIYLSYGLVVMGLVAVAVLVAARSWTPLLPAVVGALAVVAVFTALGFWWLDGYHLVVQRYYQGIAADRTYSYWIWANVAALVCAVGIATPAGVRRALAPSRLRRRDGLSLLVVGALLAVVAADVSGLSRSETERIWLPFGVWLLAATALLPVRHQRAWLATGAVTALAIKHLLLTG
jgi:hypothetical protein